MAGDTAEKTLPILEQYRAENKGVLFAYSVEVDEHEAAGKSQRNSTKEPIHKLMVNEIIHSVDVAADFEDQRRSGTESSVQGRRTWVAVKLVRTK